MSKHILPAFLVLLVAGVIWRLVHIVLTPEVGFVLPRPRVAHLACDSCADALESTLQRLGVETDRTQHDDHTDVHYSCPRWKVAVVDSHKRVDDWKRWLHDKGFATNH